MLVVFLKILRGDEHSFFNPLSQKKQYTAVSFEVKPVLTSSISTSYKTSLDNFDK